jgi:hypothetical protein
MLTQKKLELLNILRSLRHDVDRIANGLPPEKLLTQYAICVNVYRHVTEDSHQIDEAIAELFRKWPKFTGDYWYPIPSPDPNVYPAVAHMNCSDLWGDNTYGNMRKELLVFMITELEAEHAR